MNLFNLLRKNVKINPSKVIIKLEKDISYSEFWNLISTLANYLYKNKYKKVGILENDKKDYTSYVAMFATLMSGGTYVPINALTPNKRIKFILDKSKANILISQKKITGYKLKNFNEKNLLKLKKVNSFKLKKSNNDAYIIFTSGSTGEPKGVRISRKSLDHYISWITKKFFNDKKIRCSQHPGIGFDLSVADIYGTICSGGTLFPIKSVYDKLFLNRFIKVNKLTHWISVPSAIDLICNNKFFKKKDLSNLKKMFFCGEILKKIHLDKIFRRNRDIKVINSYGPTEATVSCTAIKLNNSNYNKYSKPTVSIGRAIKNINIGLTNKTTKNMGELFISGPQISSGYLNNHVLNKKKFTTIGNKNVFLTGDICKIYKGKYYFLNRSDRQVKINGNRIELEEIDSLIEKFTKSTSYTSIINNKIITFYSGKTNLLKLQKKLSQYLPKYMLPKVIIDIKKWPRNKNLKIDEKILMKQYLNGK